MGKPKILFGPLPFYAGELPPESKQDPGFVRLKIKCLGIFLNFWTVLSLWTDSHLSVGMNMSHSSYPQTKKLFKKLGSNCKIGGSHSGVVLSNILRCDAVSIG